MSTVSSTQSSIAAPPTLGLAPYATLQVRLLLSISFNAFQSPFNLNVVQSPVSRLTIAFTLIRLLLSIVFYFECLSIALQCLSLSLHCNGPLLSTPLNCPELSMSFNALQPQLPLTFIAFQSQCCPITRQSPHNGLHSHSPFAFNSFPFHRTQSLSVSALLLLAEHVGLVPSSCITWLLLQSPYAQ